MSDTHKKLVRSKSGLRIVSVSSDDISPLHLVEPSWVPDNACVVCMQCQSKFDFIRRRHHCRRCGKCFCDSCCKTKVPLPRMCFVDPVRLCAACAQTTKKENDFFDRHLKILVGGAYFHVTSSAVETDDNVNSPVYSCKLQSDYRFLVFDTSEEHTIELSAIPLSKIDSVQILTSGTDPQGNTVATGLALKFKDEAGIVQSVKMVAMQTGSTRQSTTWIAAMQRAMKMLYEGREAKTV